MELNEYLSAAHRKRAGRQRRRRTIILLVVGIAAVAGVAWIIGWSRLTRVDAIVVRGATTAADGEVVAVADAAFGESRSFLKILGMRNMLAWPTEVPSSALALEPRLMTATLTKNYGTHAITVDVADYIRRERDQLRGVFAHFGSIRCGPAGVDPQVTAVGPAQ
jgi:hypothetical protein